MTATGNEACGSGTDCDEECWLRQADFDNGNPSTTCADEGYDCCGDGWCEVDEEGSSVCQEDCGAVTSCTPPPVRCDDDGDCGTGQSCNPAGECVTPGDPEDGEHTPPCGGECEDNGDCCGNEVCMGDAVQKSSAIPESTYCPDPESCDSNLDCEIWASQFICVSWHRDVFCDPGIGRCQFNQGSTVQTNQHL